MQITVLSYQVYGDQALLINFEQKIDRQINAQVHALYAKIQATNLIEITFCIPAYCSLTVAFNSNYISYEDIVEKIKIIAQKPFDEQQQNARLLKIPVCYEAEFAPDIIEVAVSKNLTIKELITLHTSVTYDVYMLGFLPGFVYMGKLPKALEVSRKINPRLEVPSGSVGLAGFQTGIYPSAAPGGWQIIGQTPYSIFDVKRTKPFLFETGDKVQFEEISYLDFKLLKKENNIVVKENLRKKIENTVLKYTVTTFYFQKSGAQTLIQDVGRKNYLSFGVPQSGPMDKHSAEIANTLVGNTKEAPILEMALIGAKIDITGNCQIAITGADLSPKLDNIPVSMYETIDILKDSTLSFGFAKSGCRTYLAVGGTWQIPKILDSYSAMPYSGKMTTPNSFIEKDAKLKIVPSPFISKKIYPIKKRPNFPKSLRVRVLAGPEFDDFSNYTIAYFFSRAYRITKNSNRMGYRLDTKLIDFKPKREIISSGIIPGTIQITNAGQPVILMADAQTTGGYYRIANVVSADLDALGQLKTGDEIWFSLVRLSEVVTRSVRPKTYKKLF